MEIKNLLLRKRSLEAKSMIDLRLDSVNRYRFAKLSVAISTHIFMWGAVDELIRFLSDKVWLLVVFKHPFYKSRKRFSEVVIKENVRITRKVIKPRLFIEFADYVLDALATLVFCITLRKRYDMFIGVNPLNALVGLILRRIGFCRIVVYYSIDFVYERFRNRALNLLYHLVEVYCSTHCHATWNISPRIINARSWLSKKLGLELAPSKQLVVPVPISQSDIHIRPIDEIIKYSLVYAGSFRDEVSIEMILNSLKELAKIFPDLKLVLIGDGPSKQEWARLVQKSGLSNVVKFVEFIPSRAKFIEFLSRFSVGLAVYKPDVGNLTNYADVGKIKTYAACGLPVIITNNTFNAAEIKAARAGEVISYDSKEFMQAVTKLFTNMEYYLTARKNIALLAEKYNAESVFTNALKKTISLYFEVS